MSRFAFGRVRRRDGSRRTARAGRLPRTSITATTPALLPHESSQLSDGVVVETELIARLLGLRLLRVDGIVLMSPAHLVRPMAAASRDGPTVPSRARAEVGSGPNGQLLAQAAQLLQENEVRLRRLR